MHISVDTQSRMIVVWMVPLRVLLKTILSSFFSILFLNHCTSKWTERVYRKKKSDYLTPYERDINYS